ncbi:sulfotransferase domain-containing protein [Candidatus Pelagibacter bacterium nBUS_29]|uniref:sulfotransferase domain-containing protein n=1 Tax=Candidatus Pelagibacter bacterium nBUS_29 TaxID=3374190 RepID=UPI003EBD60AA
MIIWLTSYPKSGNTWVRSIVAALMYTEDGVFNFDLLKRIKQFPDKAHFKNFTNDYGNFHEIKKHWIVAQDLINLDNKVKFLKTHHINCKVDNHNFTNKKNTLATIYIVRDPRNLVNSISNHYSKTLEESKEFLFTPKLIGGYKKNGDLIKDSLKDLLGTWNEHYKFWKNNNKDFLLIKYEDLIKDARFELERIISFIKNYTEIQSNEKKIENIIKTTNFKYLKNLEEKGYFNENAYEIINKKIKFFNLGPENNWKKLLDKKIIEEIETKFSAEMKELGYLK